MESCNGVDDDGDGMTDDSLAAPLCSLQLGVCQATRQSCTGLFGWRACNGPDYGADYEPVELSCDGLDNNCDGATDVGLYAPLCGKQQGVWAGEQQACAGAAGWAACGAAEYGAGYESGSETLCDGLDNDCDGPIDEGFPTLGSLCSAGVGACERPGYIACSGGAAVCNAKAGAAGAEQCDGRDDDCDGVVDNGLLVGGKYATTAHCGGCGIDCDAIYAGVPNATPTCGLVNGNPFCDVVCDAGTRDLCGASRGFQGSRGAAGRPLRTGSPVRRAALG